MTAKKLAAEKAVEKINDGMIVGLGTGSTAYYAILKIGENVKQGLNIKAVATSRQSENLAKELNIPIIPMQDIEDVDITIDGADEVDKNKNLIKGGGGALLREKIIAFASRQLYIIADESKVVNTLGKFPLPVEIIPFGAELTLKHLSGLKCNPSIRKVKTENFVTDNGNLIADCKFENIDNPAMLDTTIRTIPGVVETGLFLNTMVSAVFIGYESGEVRVR